MALTIGPDPLPFQVDTHGTIRIAGTRLTLESLLALYEQGKTPAEIMECFDGITLQDVYAVLSYYLRHRAEVDVYLAEQEAASAAVWGDLEAQGPANPFRERVLAQRKQREG